MVSISPDRTFHVPRRFRPQPGNDVAQFVGRGVKRVGILSSPTAHIGRPGPPVNVSIAILDSGIDPHHPDLNVIGGYNCTSPNRFAWSDDEGHGTMVAGLAAARDNAIDIVGIAPGARLWAIKVLDANLDATDASILCGVDWVAAHAPLIDVANMSFGGQPDNSTPGQRFDDTTCGLSDGDILHTAICRVHQRGVVQVAAAGNSRIDSALARPQPRIRRSSPFPVSPTPTVNPAVSAVSIPAATASQTTSSRPSRTSAHRSTLPHRRPASAPTSPNRTR